MDDLDLIKQKINVVDLISEYLPLKKSGVNFKANCPFHQEKTPSFVVSPERGIWHCFGCNKGGDIFKFVMEKEGLEFTEVIDLLAKKAGITLTKRKKDEKKSQNQKLFEINLKTAEFFHHLLIKHKLGQTALSYLKNRGLTDSTIEKFNLGYAPNSWHSLTQFLSKRGFSREDIILSGVAAESKSNIYDRFRGRIIFPLVDVKDQVIGFAGRIVDTGEPKYLNSPQTPIFDKGSFLYGLNLVKTEIRKENAVVLVEGEMDMILSFQAGVKNVVASKGTGLTQHQIELIKKYTDTLILCFDEDLAGDNALRRGIEMAEQSGLNMKVIKLGDSKDPAEMVKEDPNLWIKATKEAQSIYDYYLSSAAQRYNLNKAEDKKSVVAEILPIIGKIPDSITKEHYLQKLSALVSTPEDILRRQLKGKQINNFTPYQTVLKQTDDIISPVFKPRRELLEEYLLVLILKIPSSLTYVPNFPETLFLSDNFKSLYVLLVVYLDSISFKGSSFKIEDFVKTLPPDLTSITDRLYLTEIGDKLIHPIAWKKEVETVILELRKMLIKASLEKLSDQIKSAQAFGKIDILENLNRRFRDLSVKLKNM